MPTPPEPQPLTTFDASQNIRDSITNLDDDALRASLKEFGWKRHLPAFVDENNLVLVGHRRMRIAAELGIEPVVVKLELGTGTAAENERRIMATTSNIGFAEMSIASRRKLAVQFCQQGMTQTAVAAMLGVGQATISRDLEALSTVNNAPKPVTDKLGRKNTGRRGSGTKASKPEIRDTEAVDDDEPHLSVAAKLARLPDDERQQVLRGLPRMTGSSSSYGPTLTGKGKRIALERIAAIEASKAKADTKPADKPRAEITPLAADGAKDETNRLRKELEEAKAAVAALKEELRLARNEIDMVRFTNRSLQGQITFLKGPKPVKPPKPPLDPESAAAREIKALKTRVSNLTRQLKSKDHREIMALAADAPFTVRGKMAKALSEDHTSPEARLAALQAWNGLGANNGSKTARRVQ